jgi:DNA repair protein RadC
VSINHPSGDPTPNPDDHELTKRLAAAGVVMGIDLIAQAQIEDLPIITNDEVFDGYGVTRLW